MSKYAGKWNQFAQSVILDAEEAHLPHVSVAWYDGGIDSGGDCAVRPGETPEQAAHRAFPRSHGRPNLRIRPLTLYDTYTDAKAAYDAWQSE